MTRMFMIVNSDGRRTPEKIAIHEEMNSVILYGSAKDSKLVATIIVNWKEGNEYPSLTLEYNENLDDVNIIPIIEG